MHFSEIGVNWVVVGKRAKRKKGKVEKRKKKVEEKMCRKMIGK